MAYITTNAKFTKYRQAPLKEGYREMHNIKDKEWAVMQARDKRTDAEVVGELITKDMRGYTAKLYTADQQRELQSVQEARRQEFQNALSQANDTTSRALTTPGFVGA